LEAAETETATETRAGLRLRPRAPEHMYNLKRHWGKNITISSIWMW